MIWRIENIMTSTRLIGVGVVPTIINTKLVVGDRLVYNNGEVYLVASVKKVTKGGRTLILMSETTRKFYDRRFMNNGHSVVIEGNKFVRERV
jgi:hypothetical protein